MKTIVKEKLEQIEKDYNVKIIYACEGGSRSRGLASAGSDYDVRFIYVSSPEWYLSIQEKKDVIQLPSAVELEFHGWDIRKALFLLKKSNPQLLEWLSSEVVYREKKKLIDLVREKSREHFSEVALIHHYINMAGSNYRKLRQGDNSFKMVLNVLRPLLACKWTEKYRSIPPAPFYSLVEASGEEKKFKDAMLKMAEMKKNTQYEGAGEIPRCILDFIETELPRLENFAAKPGLDKNDRKYPGPSGAALDELFRYCIAEMWGSSFQVQKWSES